MAWITRLRIVLLGIVANTVLAVMWVRGGLLLVNIGENLVGTSGPFTGAFGMLRTVVPLLIALMYIVLIGFLVYGPVREERARAARRPP